MVTRAFHKSFPKEKCNNMILYCVTAKQKKKLISVFKEKLQNSGEFVGNPVALLLTQQ